MFRRPSLGLAEIAWRWSFGAAAGLLVTLCCLEYLDTLPVSRGNLLLLRSRQPVLISQAVGNIVRGSGPRLVQAFIVLAIALTAGWILVAALARAATIQALLVHFREGSSKSDIDWRLDSLVGLNFLRTAIFLAAIVGCCAGFVLGNSISVQDEAAVDATFLIGTMVGGLVWLAWSMMNWFLSLAAIFVVANGRNTFGAIADAVDFLRHRAGPVFAVGTWFGLAHVTVFMVAGSAAAFPLGLATVLPSRFVLVGLLVVMLLYFAVADFVYIGRLAAYVAILELPPEPGPPPSVVSPQPTGGIDSSELILSEVPSPA
jgi:hypothetical protein